MKLDILPKELAEQVEGKHVTYEKLKAFCGRFKLDIACNDMQGGSDLGTHAKTALVAIQMLWNELEEVKAKLEEAYERT